MASRLTRTKEQVERRVLRLVDAFQKRAQATGNRLAEGRIGEVTVVLGYAEPGYGGLVADDVVIALGNWNRISRYREHAHPGDDLPARLGKRIEQAGADIQWSDEWDTCCRCGRAIRVSPDSYSWKRSYVVENDCEVSCGDCTLEDPASYLASLEGDESRAVTLDVDPAKHGYKRLPRDFESGFHQGQDDDPGAIAKALRARGVERFLFRVDDVGQFDVSFSAYVHESEVAGSPLGALVSAEEARGRSPSAGLKAALQDSARAEAAVPPGDGPIVVKLDVAEGKATAKRVSPEEFIDGEA